MEIKWSIQICIYTKNPNNKYIAPIFLQIQEMKHQKTSYSIWAIQNSIEKK